MAGEQGTPKPKAMRLKNLIDVSADLPGDNFFLLYDAAIGRWIPRPITDEAIPDGGIKNNHLAGGITSDKLAGGITNAQLAGGITAGKLAEDYPLQADFDSHVADLTNPHAVTYTQVGAAAAVHAHDDATTSTAGFMSPSDKVKLDGLGTGGGPDTGNGVAAWTLDTSVTALSGMSVQAPSTGWYWVNILAVMFIDQADGISTLHLYKNGSFLESWPLDMVAGSGSFRLPVNIGKAYSLNASDILDVRAAKASGGGTSEFSGQGTITAFLIP